MCPHQPTHLQRLHLPLQLRLLPPLRGHVAGQAALRRVFGSPRCCWRAADGAPKGHCTGSAQGKQTFNIWELESGRHSSGSSSFGSGLLGARPFTLPCRSPLGLAADRQGGRRRQQLL